MSNPENATVADLQKQIDELNARLAQQDNSGSTAASVNTTPTSGPGSFRAPSDNATIVGVGADIRGGHVVGYSDGTVKLVGVPANTDGSPAEPFGSAAEGEYVQFFVDDNGNRYNWLDKSGDTVASVDNPVQARP